MQILINSLIIIVFITIIDFFSYKALNTIFNQILNRNILAKLVFFSSTVITIVFFVITLTKVNSTDDIFAINYLYTLIGIIVLFYIPKLNISICYGLDNISFLLFKKHFFLNYIGFGIAVVFFLLVVHGMFINKTNFQTREQFISSRKIPMQFNNFKIIQISDLHIGSFHKDSKSIERLVKQINSEEPDIIVFTGDMISNYAKEMNEFIPILSGLEAEYGKYAILGNHDYGEYVNWKSKEEKQQNLIDLKRNYQEIGFVLLDNNNTIIAIEDQKIQLVGVENWGLPPFPQFGDIKASIKNLDESKFTILLSHDPSHWRAEVLKYPFIDLCLSGHTHAMQYGFEIGSWQWSPVSLKYPEWGGLYKADNQFLYVNRGTGYIGFPGRIGIRPEITKFILKPE